MKKVLLAVAVLCLASVNCHATVRVLGNGSSSRFDPAGFPPNMKANYEIMRVKCARCHSLERIVVALTTGVAPISGQTFDCNAIRAYGIKMLRKPESNMSKQEVKATVDLMYYILSEATH